MSLAHDTEGSIRTSGRLAATLVVVGDLDIPIMWPIAEHLAAGIDGARLVTIAVAAHRPSLERPDRFNEVVLGFLGEI